jgi:DNA uptake protein ComE-like DNA-binding protein
VTGAGAGAGAARASLALAAVLGAAALAPERGAPPCAALSTVPGAPAQELRCGAEGDPLPDAARLVLGLRLDPNRADPRALEALPGVGPRRAAAWVHEREKKPLCSVADLDRVSGIGPRTLHALGPWLDFAASRGCSPGPGRPMEAAADAR